MSDTITPKLEFTINTEVFEGPLELLLELVEHRKLLINDISLAAVTDEYMRHVAEMQEMSMSGTAQFVALAATLLLIKSKSLLPILELTEDEESAIEDLEERLRLYQVYRGASREVAERFGSEISHERLFVSATDPLFTPDSFCTTEALGEAMYRVVQELPVKPTVPKVQIRKVISLEEMMERLHKRIENQVKLKFSELLGNDKQKVTAIVGFLAILESVKQGTVLVAQLQRFADIEIERERASLPRYNG